MGFDASETPNAVRQCRDCLYAVGEHCTNGAIKSAFSYLIDVPYILPRSNPFSQCGPDGTLWRPLS